MNNKNHQKHYRKLVTKLVKIREKKNLTHLHVSVTTGWSTSFVEEFETLQTFIAPTEIETYAEAVGKKVYIRKGSIPEV